VNQDREEPRPEEEKVDDGFVSAIPECSESDGESGGQGTEAITDDSMEVDRDEEKSNETDSKNAAGDAPSQRYEGGKEQLKLGKFDMAPQGFQPSTSNGEEIYVEKEKRSELLSGTFNQMNSAG